MTPENPSKHISLSQDFLGLLFLRSAYLSFFMMQILTSLSLSPYIRSHVKTSNPIMLLFFPRYSMALIALAVVIFVSRKEKLKSEVGGKIVYIFTIHSLLSLTLNLWGFNKLIVEENKVQKFARAVAVVSIVLNIFWVWAGVWGIRLHENESSVKE